MLENNIIEVNNIPKILNIKSNINIGIWYSNYLVLIALLIR